MSEIVVIAVDGPAASGKGTLARRIAAELGYAYLDTGLLYRAIGLELLRDGEDPADAETAAAHAVAFDATRRATSAALAAPDWNSMGACKGAGNTASGWPAVGGAPASPSSCGQSIFF